MRRAELKVEPIEGDDYPAELVVFAFPGGAGTVEANLERWQKLFKDKDGNPPKIESKKVKGKNVEVTRAETSGHYHPAQFPGTATEPDRPDARLLGAIVMTDEVSYVHQDGRPRQDDDQDSPRLRRAAGDDQGGREVT